MSSTQNPAYLLYIADCTTHLLGGIISYAKKQGSILKINQHDSSNVTII